MDSFDILVIILSVTLSVFLVISIVAAVMFIKLIKKIGSATDSAKHTIENVEALTGTFKNVANGSIIAGVVGSIFEKFKNRTSNKRGK